MTTVFLVRILFYMAFPIIIKSQGKANFLIDYAGIFTFFVMGCVYIAIGMVISALTESPVIALLSTFGVLLVMYLGDALLAYLPVYFGCRKSGRDSLSSSHCFLILSIEIQRTG